MGKLQFAFSVAGIALAIVASASAASADEPVGAGGPGESCRARSDCGEGLKCMANVCKDEHEGTSCAASSDCGGKLSCVSNTCVVPGQAPPASGGSSSGTDGSSGGSSSGGSSSSSGGSSGRDTAGSEDNFIDGWKGFSGLRPEVGMVLEGGPLIGVGGGGSGTTGSFLFALKGGLLIDRLELLLELSPVTWLPAAAAPAFPAFQVNAAVGYYIPITRGLSYPIRGGLGMGAYTAGGSALMEFRADLVGLAALVGPALIELNLPSLRVFTEFDQGAAIVLLFGVQAAILPDAF